MKKQKGLGLIRVLLIIGAAIVLTAGGVVVWNNKEAQLPISFLPSFPISSPAVSSCESMRGACMDVMTYDWYYNAAFNKCVQPHSACQGDKFTSKEECEKQCLAVRTSSEILALPTPSSPIINSSSNSQTILKMQGYQFDPLAGTPSVSSEFLISYPSGISGFHIIQLIGPTQDPWLDQIGNSGVEILQYIAPYSYLVRMTPEQANLVRQFDFVRWVGVYHPIYRMASNLSGSGGIIPVSVSIYDDGKDIGGTIDKTIKAIEKLGGEFVRQEKAGVTDPFVYARFRIFAPNVVSVAQLYEVIWINLDSW